MLLFIVAGVAWSAVDTRCSNRSKTSRGDREASLRLRCGGKEDA